MKIVKCQHNIFDFANPLFISVLFLITPLLECVLACSQSPLNTAVLFFICALQMSLKAIMLREVTLIPMTYPCTY